MNIKDYLHHYYWQLCQFIPNHLQGTTKKYYGYIKELPSSGTEVKIEITESEDGDLEDAPTVWAFMSDIKPLLRRLSDMTDKEWDEIEVKTSLMPEAYGFNAVRDNFMIGTDEYRLGWTIVNEALNLLRKAGVDVDGLIDAGLAIDSNTINK